MSHSNSTTPLNSSSKLTNSTSNVEPAPISRIGLNTMNALGLIRAGVGVACLIAPQFTCGLFRLPITAQTAFIARIVGSREIVLGDLTFTAKKDQKDRTDVRRLLQANFAADVMDVGALAYAFTTGMVSKTGLGLFGSGAVVFVGMAAAGLRSL